jgi:hypothetical protein
MRRVEALARHELIAFAVALLVCALGLSILHQQTKHHYRLSAGAAVAAARANATDRRFLAKNPTNAVRVIPLDGELQRVTFFDGPQVVLDAAVGPHGEVRASEEHVAGQPASGAAIANSPWMLGLLTALFLLATTVVPLRALRNLDALVLASLTATVLLINARLAGASVVWAWLALSYLLVRCLFVGLRAEHARTPPHPPRRQSTPLLAYLCAGWTPRRRTRLLRALVLATMIAFAMVTLSSAGYTDVAIASLQGATEILHGALPYGHITLALHGDTYPLLNYLLYVPGALLQPVSTPFSELSGSLAVTLAASLIAGAAFYRFAGAAAPVALAGERREDRRLRAVLAWFSFPPVLLAASGGANDVLLAACLAWMLALRTRAGASLLALAIGVWVKLVPLVLVAIWVPYRRRDLLRSCAGAIALSLVLTGALVALGGPGALVTMVKAMAFQFQRGSFFAPWYTFDLQWLQPFAQAGALALVVVAVMRMRAERSLRGDVVRLSALAAALLLSLQLAADYWTWSYLPWVFPLLFAALLLDGDERTQTTVNSRGRPVSTSQPSSPTTTSSSMRTPRTPGTYTPGSTVTTLPARSGSPSGAVRDSRGASWISIPTPWPRPWPKCSPWPAASITSRASASTSRPLGPARTASRPRCWARSTSS